MDCGDYKHPIVIKALAAEPVFDNDGNDITDYVPLMKCRAKINGVGSKEYYAASAYNAENDLTFEVRYCKRLAAINLPETIIEYGGGIYDIKQIDDYMQSHVTLKIRAVNKSERAVSTNG